MSQVLTVRKSDVELFPNGWCVRRTDGTIATIQGVGKLGLLSAQTLARHKARTMDLNPVPFNRNQVSLDRLPTAVIDTKHRSRGEEWKIYLSFQLPLCSSGTGKMRKHRWCKASIGRVDQITTEDIERAWRRVYGAWAWATDQKSNRTTVEIMGMPLPEKPEEFLQLIALPEQPSVEGLWARIGFDPKTGLDNKARRAAIK